MTMNERKTFCEICKADVRYTVEEKEMTGKRLIVKYKS